MTWLSDNGYCSEGHEWYHNENTRQRMSESAKANTERIERLRQRAIEWNKNNPYDGTYVFDMQNELGAMLKKKNRLGPIVVKNLSIPEVQAVMKILKKLPD